MTQRVVINVGVSGSGKTKWSTEYIKKNPEFVRINRDDIRKMLVGTLEGYYKKPNLNKLEEYVTELEELLFVNAVSQKYSVIIDNTNLKQAYINKWMDFVEGWNEGLPEEEKAEVCFAIFGEANVTELKKRVNVRDAPASWKDLDYIDKQYASFRPMRDFLNKNHYEKIIYESISNTNPSNEDSVN